MPRVNYMMQWLHTFLNSLGNMGLPGGALFVLSFAGFSMFGMPLIPFAVTAGLLFGMGAGLAAVIAGSTLGAACGFMGSRRVARRRFAKFLERHPKFAIIEEAIRQEGWKIVCLLRMCPLSFGLSNYCYGLTNISFGHYLAATIIGMLPGEIVFVYLGATGRRWFEAPETIRNSPAVKALFFLGLVAAVLVLVLLRKLATKRIALTGEAGR